MFKKLLALLILSTLTVSAWAQIIPGWGKNERHTYVEIRTVYGVGVVKLYRQTTQHSDNFTKLVKDRP